MPVGICFNCTADEVLFCAVVSTLNSTYTLLKLSVRANIEPLTIFCPPGPLPHKNASVKSSSGSNFGLSGIFFAHTELEPASPRCWIANPNLSTPLELTLIRGRKLRIIVHFVQLSAAEVWLKDAPLRLLKEVTSVGAKRRRLGTTSARSWLILMKRHSNLSPLDTPPPPKAKPPDTYAS